MLIGDAEKALALLLLAEIDVLITDESTLSTGSDTVVIFELSPARDVDELVVGTMAVLGDSDVVEFASLLVLANMIMLVLVLVAEIKVALVSEPGSTSVAVLDRVLGSVCMFEPVNEFWVGIAEVKTAFEGAPVGLLDGAIVLESTLRKGPELPLMMELEYLSILVLEVEFELVLPTALIVRLVVDDDALVGIAAEYRSEEVVVDCKLEIVSRLVVELECAKLESELLLFPSNSVVRGAEVALTRTEIMLELVIVVGLKIALEFEVVLAIVLIS